MLPPIGRILHIKDRRNLIAATLISLGARDNLVKKYHQFRLTRYLSTWPNVSKMFDRVKIGFF